MSQHAYPPHGSVLGVSVLALFTRLLALYPYYAFIHWCSACILCLIIAKLRLHGYTRWISPCRRTQLITADSLKAPKARGHHAYHKRSCVVLVCHTDHTNTISYQLRIVACDL